MDIREVNHWWTEKSVKESLAPKTYRDMYFTMRKDLNRRHMQVLVGLRRVGKSTIFYQIIDNLIKEGIDPLKILYVSFDNITLQEKGIGKILREYSQLTNVNYKNDRIYLFLDEVQKRRGWILEVKLLYDNYPNIKILLSGSASLNLISEAKKSLAGRAIYYELTPLTFREFLNFKGIGVEEDKINLYEDTLRREFQNFRWRVFPEIVNEEDKSFIKEYVRDAVIEPVIFRDIPHEFGEVDVLLLESLILMFLSNPGTYLKVDEIAKDFRRSKMTIYNAIFYLEASFLIKRVYNFRPSIRAASRKLSRIYAYHPVLCLPFEVSDDKFAENLVLSALNTKYYWREGEKEVDFVKDTVPYEVKYKSKIDREDLRWIRYYMRKYGSRFKIDSGYVISKDFEGVFENIHITPIWKFCLKSR